MAASDPEQKQVIIVSNYPNRQYDLNDGFRLLAIIRLDEKKRFSMNLFF